MLAPFAPPPITSAEFAGLVAFFQAADAADDGGGAAQAPAAPQPSPATLSGSGPGPAPTLPPTSPASIALANTFLAGLRLVSTPPASPTPEPPPLPPLPPEVIASLSALLNLGVAPANLPRSLIAELTAGIEGFLVERSSPPLPVPVLGNAIAVWIAGA